MAKRFVVLAVVIVCLGMSGMAWADKPAPEKDVFPPDRGGTQLVFTPETGGDDCASALDISSIAGFTCDETFYFDDPIGMATATASGGPSGSCWYGVVDNDRWYMWTNTTGDAKRLTITTDDAANTGGDSQIAVYDDCAGTTELACNDDIDWSNYLSTTDLVVAPGETVYIQLDGYYGDTGFERVLFSCGNPAVVPPNDDCGSATVISTAIFTETLDTSLATTAVDDPETACGSSLTPTQSASVWYSFTATDWSRINIGTCGSSYDTVLAVYDATTGCPVATSDTEVCNDDSCGLQSEVEIIANAGEQYLIEVMAYGSGSGGTLEFSFAYDVLPVPGLNKTVTIVLGLLVFCIGAFFIRRMTR